MNKWERLEILAAIIQTGRHIDAEHSVRVALDIQAEVEKAQNRTKRTPWVNGDAQRTGEARRAYGNGAQG